MDRTRHTLQSGRTGRIASPIRGKAADSVLVGEVAALRAERMMDMLSDLLRPILTKMEHDEIAKRSQSIAKRKAAEKL
jgi:hypothetical protein